MILFDRWEIQVIIYLVSACIFARSFKVSNRNMKDANSLTVLLELTTACFAIFLIPFFEIKFPSDFKIYISLFMTVLIYAVTDRLNTEARYGLEPSTFSMLKQLSTVFIIIFGFIFLKEKVIPIKLLGALIIILSNILMSYDKGKLKINKYFIMSFLSNFLFAIAMLINVNIADYFNLAIYTFITVFIPAIIIFLFNNLKYSNLKNEFSLYKKREFILAGGSWCLMLVSSVRAYQLKSVLVVAPLFALTSIINALFEFVVDNNKNNFVKKIISGIAIIIGIILIRK